MEGYQDCELRGQQRRPQETRLSFSKDTKRTQVSGALSSPAEDLLCHLQVCFETYKATNLRQHAAQCLGRQGYRLVLHTPDSLGPLLGCSGIHRPCFPCPGGRLCWEHQEAQTAGKSLGSMSWLVSHGCISLQVFKMQIKPLLGFWEMTSRQRKSDRRQHREGQPAGDLGLLQKLLHLELRKSSVFLNETPWLLSD